MINTSRVTVSNVFSLFADEGILEKVNGLFVVTDFGKLESLASGEEELAL